VSPACHICDRRIPAVDYVQRVGVDAAGEPVWACHAHIGRCGCIVPLCRRSFKLERGASWDVKVMCGRHWRMAPKRMRDATARARRRALRSGWAPRESAAFVRLWMRTARAAIEATFGL